MRHSTRLCAVLALTFFSSSFLWAQHFGAYTVDRLRCDVHYDGRIVEDADISTFEDIGYGYGKDRRHVYRFGRILEYVDPSSFRVSPEFASGHESFSDYFENGDRNGHDCPYNGGSGYYRKESDVYYRGRRVSGNSLSNVDIMEGGYAKDSFNVYWNGREMDGVSVSSFECLGWGYAKDSFNVYWNGREIDNAKASSFRYLGYGYAADSFNVYWCGNVVDGAKASSFKVMSDGYAEDAFNTYYRGRKID